MQNLIIDPEFRDKIPPLTAEEFSKLEENILADGEVREPLVLWNDTLIDGHHRWQIIQKHPEIPYKVKRMEFSDKWAAVAWMCSNQLGRRNLTDEQKTYLLGKQYEAQKMTQGTNNQYVQAKSESPQNGAFQKRSLRTSQIIAKEHGVGKNTVERAEHFAKGLDEADRVSPGIKQAVLSGEVKAPKKVISEIRNMPEKKKEKVVEAIRKNDGVTLERLTRPNQPFIPIPNATPVEQRPPYNVEDFREELMDIVKNMESCFKQTLVLAHREMLDTAEGRDAAREVLSMAKSEIQKYVDMIQKVEDLKNNETV